MKNICKLLFLLSCLGLPASVAHAATPDERLIGTWEEYEPSSNVVQFDKDHTMKLYLTQEEGAGQKPPLHYLGGTWSITGSEGAYVLTMHISANGQSIDQQAKLKFTQEEMVLIDRDDGETRHRRLKGSLPKKYVW